MNRLALVASVLLSACAMKPPSGPAAGKAYFGQAGCLTCHRVGGDGGATGPDLTLVGFRHSAAWLDRWLMNPQQWKPGTLMPNTQLSPSARAAIVSYLATLKGQDWPAGAPPWDALDGAARGRQIYLRAGCVSCHGAGGIGGYPNNNVRGGKIPAVNGVAQAYTKAELIQKISAGVAAPQPEISAAPAPLVAMPRWSDKLSQTDIESVADYLLTLKPDEAAKTDW